MILAKARTVDDASLCRRTVLWGVAGALIAGPGLAAKPVLGQYSGPDAGYLVLSITAQGLAEQYVLKLRYRRVGEPVDGWLIGGVHALTLAKFDIQTSTSKLHGVANFLMLSDDSDASEQGDVVVRSLAPGKYEIFNVDNFYSNGYVERSTDLKTDVSIPFEIKPGRATYIGEFKGVATYGRNIFGMTIPQGARYIVTDQSDRDIPIAQTKNVAITDVDVAVPNVDAIGSPEFVSKP